MEIGALQVLPVHDGTSRVPVATVYRGEESRWEPHRQFLSEDGQLPLEFGGFLVRSGDRTVLVDTGLGRLGQAFGCGRLFESLGRLAVPPADITDVVLTHLHFDHVGWATDEGVTTFPNATYRCAAADWRYFVEEATPEGRMAASVGAPSPAEKLAPARDRLEVWDGDGPLLPGIDVRAAPGHTPGSTVIVLSSGSARALLLGDVVHCPVELLEDEWSVLVDVDRRLAQCTREALAREIEGSDIPVAAAHFQGMKFGRLLPAEGRRRWVLVQ